MIDKLISAYRAQIYDWTWDEWRLLFGKNPIIALSPLLFILAGIILVWLCYETRSVFLGLFIVIAEGIIVFILDRYAVKRYRQFLINKENGLRKTINFLKSTIETRDLYNQVQIEELIKRLSERIEKRDPLINFTNSIINFFKGIILPIIAFVFGLVSNDLSNLGWKIICSYSIIVVLILGIIRISWGGASILIRTILCRDYDAAFALREDLLDIKLLYFTANQQGENCN